MTQYYNDMDNSEKLYNIIGAAMEVHNELHRGLTELVYQEALECELNDRNIPYSREVKVPIMYKKHLLNKYYQLDFICYDDIIVELKAAETITSDFRFQLFNYLRLTKKPCGLLINFGEERLHVERYRYDVEKNECFVFAK